MLAPIFFHPARTQPVDPLLNRRVPPSPEKEKTGRDRRRMNKKEARELSSAGFFFIPDSQQVFFPERWARSGRLLAPLFPVLSEPFWNDHSPQQLLDSRTPLRGLLRNSTISLSLKSLHELLVIARHFPRLLPTPQ